MRLRGYSIGSVVIVALGSVLALNSCVPPQDTSAPSNSVIPLDADFSGQVTRVVDGDTFWISSQNVRIRVWGLDAPETNEVGGSDATAELSRLIAGQTLRCRQRDIDRYGRIVGQCFLPDSRDITAAMIASGTASEYCRYSGNHYGTC